MQNQLKLIPLDMKLSKEHIHPEIKLKTNYLAKIGGNYFAGTFTKVWFGLNFDGWYDSLQFDAPGTNCSSWEQIWEIVED